jgi:hypothetical protein
LKNPGNVQHRRRVTLAGALLACLLIGAPAAHAAFTSSTTASMKASTYVLAAPTVSGQSATCGQVGHSGKWHLLISLTSHGEVTRANGYVIRMVSPTGVVTDWDITSSIQPYDSGTSNTVERGVWKYSVEAQYQVQLPGSTNVWSSTAVPLTITC